MKPLGPTGRLFAIVLAVALIVSVLWDAWQFVSVRTTTLAGAPLPGPAPVDAAAMSIRAPRDIHTK